MPNWVEHVVWWQVYPLGFVGAETEAIDTVEHRIGRIGDWLDYLLELGCNGLSLGPVFASETHGYDTVDHFRIDGRLGDDADIDALIAAAHGKGVKILFDGVFNHVGREHEKFRQALADGPESEAGGWFRWRGDEPVAFEGHDLLVTLNHDNPAVAEYVASVMNHWLDRGIDGWRLDAAYAVPPQFWASVVHAVRAKHPDVWFVGEMIHGDYAQYVNVSGLDSITQYELWKATWSAIEDANFFELAHAIERGNDLLDTFVPATFVGNHDVTRVASTITDERHVPHAVALLFFLAGVPSVYYGDEQGFRGVKEERVGGDDAVRPEFPAGPDDLAPYGAETFRTHQELIGIRRRHPWLHRTPSQVSNLSNTAVTLSSSHEGATLTLTLNLGDDPVSSPGGDVAGHSWAVHEG
ncbi:alpha-amylase [Rhodococcoides trifolii]|uniref:Alpha-amylase n=1 Tax=Rhodococcoides trifolii TaxID=908250 RepID=A0A917G4U4_9NOCA|nr:alpha-amylase family protein [Rhodococcus trifolii]GGG23255.1 alpha-amylase [Rhodococcus trifolii]